MLMIMKGIYHEQKQTLSKLVLTNFKYIDDINQGKLEEDELKTLKHTQQYQKIIENLQVEDLVIFTRYSLKDLTTKEFRSNLKTEDLKDDTMKFLEILDADLNCEKDIDEKLCFMDMRAEHTLGQGAASGDKSALKFIVFGGILGDHPPQDRA